MDKNIYSHELYSMYSATFSQVTDYHANDKNIMLACLLVLVVYSILNYFLISIPPDIDTDLTGRTYIVTGATSGIGLEITRQLYSKGANVLLAVRSKEKALEVMCQIRESVISNGNLVAVALDLSSFQSVRQCAKTILAATDKVHGLYNNAGVGASRIRRLTIDGIDETMQINCYSHLLFGLLLLPALHSARGHVVNTSSVASWFVNRRDLEELFIADGEYSGAKMYAKSKLLIAMLTKKAAKIHSCWDITYASVHPGVVDTGISDTFIEYIHGSSVSNIQRAFDHLVIKIIAQKPATSARNLVGLGYCNFVKQQSGHYFVNYATKCPNSLFQDNQYNYVSEKKLYFYIDKLWESVRKEFNKRELFKKLDDDESSSSLSDTETGDDADIEEVHHHVCRRKKSDMMRKFQLILSQNTLPRRNIRRFSYSLK